MPDHLDSKAQVVDLLRDMVVEHHRERLSAEQVDQVRETIAAMLASAERLEAYPLSNGQGPAFTFTADDPED